MYKLLILFLLVSCGNNITQLPISEKDPCEINACIDHCGITNACGKEFWCGCSHYYQTCDNTTNTCGGCSRAPFMDFACIEYMLLNEAYLECGDKVPELCKIGMYGTYCCFPSGEKF